MEDADAELRSGYFDRDWYLRTNPDLVASGIDPEYHYVTWGAASGWSPGPSFNAAAYVLCNPQAADNPLRHYLQQPLADGRRRPWQEIVDPSHPVLSEGWFDSSWYLQVYEGHTHNGLPAWADYVWFGAAEKRHPSPFFDAADYVERYPQAGQGTDPVSYFVQRGRGLQQWPRAVITRRDTERRPLLHPHLVDTSPMAQRVCVMVHAFYFDVFVDIVHRLSTAMPPGFTLLVSTTSDANREMAERIVDRLLGAHVRRDIRVVENRGRNFAPLLVEFGPRLGEFDAVLHLHTKKSLQHGIDRVDWRNHIFDSLFGSRALVDTTLSTMATEPTVGIIHPPAFHQLPRWAHHWLSNTTRGRWLMERIGAPFDRAEGYVQYPTGGMFWARPAALAPLVNAGLTVDDFEPEPIFHDGALAHAIERAVGPAANVAGFDVVEFDPEAPQWRLGWSTFEGYRADVDFHDQLAADASGRRVLSVDLFDTLIYRTVLDPSTLQYFAARQAGVPRHLAEAAVDCRLDAEATARRLSDRADVTINDIYHHLDAELMHNAEVAIEFQSGMPDPLLVDQLRALRSTGSRVVLATDTFHRRSTIERLIHQFDMADVFDDLYVSCEVGARKDTGTMYAVIAGNEQVDVSSWLHIGDNEFSDAQRPMWAGFSSLHRPSPRAEAEMRGLRSRDAAPGTRRGTDAIVGGAAAHLFRNPDPHWSPYRRFGYSALGPLVAAFISWLDLHETVRQADRLLFVSRDGHVFHRVAQHLAPFLHSLGRGEYFYASRRSALPMVFADEWTAGVDAAVALAVRGNFTGTLREMIWHRLGLPLISEDPALDEPIELSEQRGLATDVLLQHRLALRNHANATARGFGGYVRALHIDPTQRLALIDLGYSATTQRVLAGVLPNSIAGLYCATTPDAHAHGLDVDGCFGTSIDPDDGRHAVFANCLVLESLLSADHGHVEGWEHGPGGVGVFTTASVESDSRHRLAIAEVQDAAVAYCVDLVHRYGPTVYDEPVDPVMALKWWELAMSDDVPWARSLFVDWRFDDAFSGRPGSPIRL